MSFICKYIEVFVVSKDVKNVFYILILVDIVLKPCIKVQEKNVLGRCDYALCLILAKYSEIWRV